MTSDYTKDLAHAKAKLAALMAGRENIEIDIAKQKRRVAALAELCDDSDIADQLIDLELGGLSDACRTVLRSSRKEWMTISEIQNDLKELGFPVATYRALSASITTTVNRLVENGEVVPSQRTTPGANEYKWAGKALGLDPYTTAGQALIRARMSAGKPFTTSELRDLTTKAREKAEDERKKAFPQRLGTTVMPRNTK